MRNLSIFKKNFIKSHYNFTAGGRFSGVPACPKAVRIFRHPR